MYTFRVVANVPLPCWTPHSLPQHSLHIPCSRIIPCSCINCLVYFSYLRLTADCTLLVCYQQFHIFPLYNSISSNKRQLFYHSAWLNICSFVSISICCICSSQVTKLPLAYLFCFLFLPPFVMIFFILPL